MAAALLVTVAGDSSHRLLVDPKNNMFKGSDGRYRIFHGVLVVLQISKSR